MGGSVRKLRIRRGRPCVSAMIDKRNCCFCFASAIVVYAFSCLATCSLCFLRPKRNERRKRGKAKWHNKRIWLYLFYGIVASARRKVFLANQPQPPCSIPPLYTPHPLPLTVSAFPDILPQF